MGFFKEFFGAVLFKSTIINTFNSFASSTDNIEHSMRCEFLHKMYKNGDHEIEIKIEQGNPMKFKLVHKPNTIGEGIIMFDLASLDDKITGIDLMVMSSSAYLKFPDGSLISFKE